MTQRPLARAPEVELIQISGLWCHKSIPALFQQTSSEWPHEINGYRRVRGEWRGESAARTAQRVEHLARGLFELGIAKGDRVGILAQTRPEWGRADMAILHAGAVTVGIYPTLLGEDVAYQVDHAQARVLFVEDAAQAAKVEAARDSMPSLEHVVVFEGEAPGAMTLAELETRGAALADGAERFAASWQALGPEDMATIIYTSGTTGRPKGAILSHGNLTYVVQASVTAIPTEPGQRSVAFLPMAHALQRFASYVGIANRAVGYYTESPQTLMDDIRDVEPTIQVSVPRIWEKLHARLHEVLASSPARRQRIFDWGLNVGRQASAKRQAGQELGLGLRLRNAVAANLVHQRLKRRVFGRNIRYLTSGGAAIDTEILEFFHALDLLILEGWGLTETAAPATLNTPESFKFGTVGKPLRGTEVKVAEDGELLVRGPGVFGGYYLDEAATKAAFTEDGFFRTGDIGVVDPDGFVRITDRKKNLIVLSSGKNIAPQKLENHFQTIPLIGASLVHGDDRNYLVGLFTIDPEEAQLWAVKRGLLPPDAEPDAAALLALPALVTHLERAIGERNAQLARFEQLKKWKLLPEVWSTEDGSLTPTLKLKRRVLEARHKALLDGFYAG